MPATAEVVLFAIRAGVRLGTAVRQAYIEQTKQRPIALPIPLIRDFEPGVWHARAFFKEEGARFLAQDDHLLALHTQAEAEELEVEEQRDDYVRLFRIYYSIYEAAELGESIVFDKPGVASQPDAFLVMLRFEQWEVEHPDRPKPLRRVLGTIVDIGVEYFATTPGAINQDSRQSKLVASFVRGVDRLDFQKIALDEEPLEALIGGLLIAALETVGEQPEIIGSDKNVQKLVEVSSGALAADIAVRLEVETTTDGRDAIRSWGELVFRSVLRSAGTHVLERPEVFLGLPADNDAAKALVSRVGIAAIDLVSKEELSPERLFSRSGLDAMLSEALAVVGDHPELIVDTDNEGVEALIAAIASDLSAMPRVLDLNLAPEVGRLVLSRTGGHLELIWPDLKPERHLLLTAARVSLETLTKEPAAGAAWTPAFGRDELLYVVEAVVDEIAGNPVWLQELAGDEDTNLRAALDAVLLVLRTRADERLSTSIAAEIMAASAKAIALRQEFLIQLPNGQPLVAAAIDAILTPIFETTSSEAAWALLRGEATIAIVSTTLEALSTTSIEPEMLLAAGKTISDTVDAVAAGDAVDLDALDQELRTALAVANGDADQ